MTEAELTAELNHAKGSYRHSLELIEQRTQQVNQQIDGRQRMLDHVLKVALRDVIEVATQMLGREPTEAEARWLHAKTRLTFETSERVRAERAEIASARQDLMANWRTLADGYRHLKDLLSQPADGIPMMTRH